MDEVAHFSFPLSGFLVFPSSINFQLAPFNHLSSIALPSSLALLTKEDLTKEDQPSTSPQRAPLSPPTVPVKPCERSNHTWCGLAPGRGRMTQQRSHAPSVYR